MLPLLVVYLILCLVGMSGEGWARKVSPKTRNESFVANFLLVNLTHGHVYFMKKKRLECEIKVSLGYYFAFC